MEMSFMHISKEYRHKGLGQKLFNFACKSALALGATKLYIGSHPAYETQLFYNKMGCVDAIEINQEIYNREPLDRQLEYVLSI